MCWYLVAAGPWITAIADHYPEGTYGWDVIPTEPEQGRIFDAPDGIFTEAPIDSTRQVGYHK